MKYSNIFFVFALLFAFSCKSDKSVNDGEEAIVANQTAVKNNKSPFDEIRIENATYQVDPTATLISWIGSKPTGSHTGTITASKGDITIEKDIVTKAFFEFDMNTINCTDLTGKKKADLEGHLKNEDFFDIQKHPTATFELTALNGVEKRAESAYVADVLGKLTIKGIERGIAFAADIHTTEEYIEISSPQFVINRTSWDIMYKSKKILDAKALKDGFIHDDIGMKLSLAGKRK